MTTRAAEAALRTIEEEAKREFLPILGPEKGEHLERLVREKGPCAVVEIGVMVGYATIRIARNLGDGCKLVGFEISDDLARRAEANVTLAGLAAKTVIRRGDARELLAQVSGPVDMVFIDAERGQYLNYLRKIEPKLAPGAIVIANCSGVAGDRLRAYFDHVRLSGRYASEHVRFDDGPLEVSIFNG